MNTGAQTWKVFLDEPWMPIKSCTIEVHENLCFFLNPQGVNLDIQRIDQKLPHVEQNKSYRNVLEQLLDPMAKRPKLDMFRLFEDQEHEFLDGYCDTCAMVTNSGFLLGSKAGKFIDSNECVFRMNDGPVTGYEQDVGSRTTHR